MRLRYPWYQSGINITAGTYLVHGPPVVLHPNEASPGRSSSQGLVCPVVGSAAVLAVADGDVALFVLLSGEAPCRLVLNSLINGKVA